jgi:long-subunit acyl-CoA synthetase (AMP-forming)
MERLAKEKKLSSLEKPKTFVVWTELCSIENDCLTSTFKMKRNVVSKIFKEQIDTMYVEVAKMEAEFAATNRSAAV